MRAIWVWVWPNGWLNFDIRVFFDPNVKMQAFHDLTSVFLVLLSVFSLLWFSLEAEQTQEQVQCVLEAVAKGFWLVEIQDIYCA